MNIPPQSREFEQLIISAFLMSADNCDYIFGHLEQQDFYFPMNQKIFGIGSELYHEQSPVDALAIADRMKKNPQCGEEELELLDTLSQTAYLETDLSYYIQQIKENSIKRNILQLCERIAKCVHTGTGSAKDIVSDLECEIYQILGQKSHSGFEPIGVGIDSLTRRIRQLSESTSALTGVDTGFANLNYRTSGWQPQNLIIIAARPSIGKTALALQFSINAATLGYPVAFLSLEMSKLELRMRTATNLSNVDGKKLNTGKGMTETDWVAFKQAAEKMKDTQSFPLFIEDSPATVTDIKSKLRLLMNTNDIRLLVVDYLGFITPLTRAENKNIEIGDITHALKSIAKEYNIPVIVNCQLNREVEKRADKRPQLSDLRESGNIEQDCDICILLHSPEFYQNENGDVEQRDVEIIFSKFRNGRVGSDHLNFLTNFQRFQ